MIFGALGIDLNSKKYIVVGDDKGNEILRVELFSYVEYSFCGKRKSIVRFKDFYYRMIKEEKFITLLKQVAKDIVGYAKKYGYIIVLENLGFLKYIDKKDYEGLKRLRYGYFVYYLVRYAIKSNVKIVFVEPNGTSRQCSMCGNYLKGRKFNKGIFVCDKCGFRCDKDLNASINIARKGLFYIGKGDKVVGYGNGYGKI